MTETEAAATLAQEIPLLVDAIPAETIQKAATLRPTARQQTLQQASTSILSQVNGLPSALLKDMGNVVSD
ncbi:hypothetical protein [Streptomyces sp. NPDC017993]|uniref:hypothetical protein n=1 Tax=Streptomyces sp. NPDC017993 TaxID=3365027 RepID=UPI0037BDC968